MRIKEQGAKFRQPHKLGGSSAYPDVGFIFTTPQPAMQTTKSKYGARWGQGGEETPQTGRAVLQSDELHRLLPAY